MKTGKKCNTNKLVLYEKNKRLKTHAWDKRIIEFEIKTHILLKNNILIVI